MGRLASAADDDEITDVLAYQTALDDSVNAARTLVESWIPTGLDASWDAPPSSAEQFTAVSLASKARPPRLGLGASATDAHKLAAEEKKLRDRLLKGTAAASGSGGAYGSLVVGSVGVSSKREREDELADDSADDEDSRATAIKRKAPVIGTAAPTFNSTAASMSKPKKRKRDKTSRDGSPAPATTSTPQKAAAAPLPSTPLPPPSISTSSTSALCSLLTPNKVSTTAFYGGAAPAPAVATSTSAASPPPAQLTKNQRKKEREKERERMMKAAKIAAMHAEDAKGKGRASDDVETADDSDTLPPTPPSPVKLPRAFTKAPFAPLTSSSESEDVKAEGDDEGKSDDDDEGEGSSHPSSVAGSVSQIYSGDGLAKKKKKRRKKGKGGAKAEGGAATAPVLDLRPLGS